MQTGIQRWTIHGEIFVAETWPILPFLSTGSLTFPIPLNDLKSTGPEDASLRRFNTARPGDAPVSSTLRTSAVKDENARSSWQRSQG